jgi:glycosyltransferase involved in cell wall biosynthesis
MKKVLFVGHRADRSGAPIALLHLLRWLRARTDLAFEVVLEKGGELESCFRELAPVSVVERPIGGRRSLGGKLLNRYGRIPLERARTAALLRQLRLRADIGLIYFHSIASAALGALAADPRRSVIASVHELKGAYAGGDRDRALAVLARADEIIAVSRAVGADIAACDPLLAGKTEVIHGCVPTRQVVVDDPTETRLRMRRQLGIPQHAVVIGGSGLHGLGKGTDLFVQLARRVCERHPGKPFHFVWFGATSDRRHHELIARDAAQLALSKQLQLHGPTADSASYFAAFDVFALTSREDSFPLVVLEAACNALPILCFEGSGGAPEFVGNDCGRVVPYLDVEEMANAVADLGKSQKRRSALGAAAAAKVRECHDVDIVLPSIAEMITRRLNHCESVTGASAAGSRGSP